MGGVEARVSWRRGQTVGAGLVQQETVVADLVESVRLTRVHEAFTIRYWAVLACIVNATAVDKL